MNRRGFIAAASIAPLVAVMPALAKDVQVLELNNPFGDLNVNVQWFLLKNPERPGEDLVIRTNGWDQPTVLVPAGWTMAPWTGNRY